MKIKNFSGVLIVFALVVVGYLLYQWSNKNEGPIPPGGSPSPVPPQVEVVAPPTFLYEKPEDVLNFPSPDASEEVRDQHTKLMLSLSAVTDTIIIKNCVSDPLVARVGYGKSILIKNLDGEEHRLIHGANPQLVLPSGETNVVVSQFLGMEKSRESFFGYACDSSPAGVFHIVL